MLLEAMWGFYLEKFFVPLAPGGGGGKGKEEKGGGKKRKTTAQKEEEEEEEEVVVQSEPAAAPSAGAESAGSFPPPPLPLPPPTQPVHAAAPPPPSQPAPEEEEEEEEEKLYALKICTSKGNPQLTLRIFREATWSNGILQLFLWLCYGYYREEWLQAHAEEGGGGGGGGEGVGGGLEEEGGGKGRDRLLSPEEYIVRPDAVEVYAAREEHFLRKLMKGWMKQGVLNEKGGGCRVGLGGVEEEEEEGKEGLRRECEALVGHGLLVKEEMKETEKEDGALPLLPATPTQQQQQQQQQPPAEPFSTPSSSPTPTRPTITYRLNLTKAGRDVEKWDFEHPCVRLLLRKLDLLYPPSSSSSSPPPPALARALDFYIEIVKEKHAKDAEVGTSPPIHPPTQPTHPLHPLPAGQARALAHGPLRRPPGPPL